MRTEYWCNGLRTPNLTESPGGYLKGSEGSSINLELKTFARANARSLEGLLLPNKAWNAQKGASAKTTVLCGRPC